jgi:hypothetical protein
MDKRSSGCCFTRLDATLNATKRFQQTLTLGWLASPTVRERGRALSGQVFVTLFKGFQAPRLPV